MENTMSTGKAAKLLTDDGVIHFELRGDDSAIEVRIPGVPTFCGVLMPMKAKEGGKNAEPEGSTIDENGAVSKAA